MTDMFHLGWFLNFVADEWNGNWGDGGRDFTGDFYVEMAKDLERAKFDYVLIEDKLMVSTAHGDTMESWEPDAIERDYTTGTYANYKKVHTIDFEGKY
jgi:hypothetical protein